MSDATVDLTDLADLEIFREVRDEVVSREAPPACPLIPVSRLLDPAFRVEIEAPAAT